MLYVSFNQSLDEIYSFLFGVDSWDSGADERFAEPPVVIVLCKKQENLFMRRLVDLALYVFLIK